MDPQIRLEAPTLDLTPGQLTAVPVLVKNPSPRVQHYALEVLPPAAAWASVEPAELRVDTDREEAAQVLLAPDANSAGAGRVPLGVRAVSLVEPDSMAVAQDW